MTATLNDDHRVAIRTDRLTKRYVSGPNDVLVFQDLSIQVYEGERLALIGESGAGKSTLLHLLGGLDRPTEGTIHFGETEISQLNDEALADFRNRHIGFVWQTHYLLPEFTAAENVMMPLLIRGIPRPEALGAARTALNQVGLEHRTEHRSGELSGGEQQRVVIARALAGQPKVLLADEPTGNLDSLTGGRIAALFRDIHQANRLTSVFVTHNLGFAKGCDRILKLEEGCLTLAALQRESELTESGAPDSAREDGTNYV
jgi:lipoprotein-releasing system ATP-binding protein